jgi:hypothetical protein
VSGAVTLVENAVTVSPADQANLCAFGNVDLPESVQRIEMTDDRDDDELPGDDQPHQRLPRPSNIRSSNTPRSGPRPAGDRIRGNQPRRHRFDQPR